MSVLDESVLLISTNAELFKENKPLANEKYDGTLPR